jgi:N-dimethylarginine dimethylaminohydrolase
MCPPTYFDVTYDINPWMTNNQNTVNSISATAQWQALAKKLSQNVDIIELSPEPNLPDMVFTANAGFVHKNTAILSKFSVSPRQPEEQYFAKWFKDQGYTVTQPKNAYEGQGDHLRDREGRHWIGTGFRTTAEATMEIRELLDEPVNVLELVDPRWYHLDTCFCPLPRYGQVMWYPAAFSKNSQELIRKSFEISIEITEKQALSFCCNAVCIDSIIFMPADVELCERLKKLAYIVEQFDLREFLKSGGSAKCLVLQIN